MGRSATVERPPEGRTRHADDLYTWTQEQVALLRSRRLEILDAGIEAQRQAYLNVLADYPELKSKRPHVLARAYARARLDASTGTNLPRSTLPADCPHSWPDILDRPFDYEAQA